jgi:hypothetical protein
MLRVMMRSRFAPGYWLLFVGCVALLVWLNLPRLDLPPQNMEALIGDSWFLYGFAHFSLLLMPAAALMAADGQRRNSKTWLLVLPYFALGILPFSAYLALRPAHETRSASGWIERALVTRWFWLACSVLSVVSAIALLPTGSWAQLQVTMQQNFGWWFMWLDILLNHVFVLPLAQAHMRHVGAANQNRWLAAIALSGPLGLNLYLTRHSSRTNMPAPYARPNAQIPR